MDKENHVGILLDGTRLTEVTKLRTFTFKAFTRFHSTIKLTQCKDWNIKFLSYLLERARYG